MMKCFWLFSAYFLFLGMSSCAEEEVVLPFPLEQGDYKGIFYKSAPHFRVIPIDIEILFSANKFDALIHSRDSSYSVTGVYHIIGNEIDFQSAEDVLINENWVSPFSERYQVSLNEEQLILTKDFGEGVYNNFLLSKE